ncbi:MAG: alpha-L-arabinofuranosidase C-terminal domain-containing protein, partial [Eubacteriales bacterium]
MEKVYLVMPKKIGIIAPEIYGVFTEHIGGVFYDGLYCEDRAENIHGFRREIIDRLRAIGTPLIRWPGGCYAEIYDWRDGIGPRESRPVRINWWTECDGRYEPNLVGTDEFLDFCSLVGAEPYFAANLTSMTPKDIRDWIDYVNSPEGSTTLAKCRAENGHPAPYDVKLWGVGNENWGGGGNMTPEFYACEYRRYAEIMANSAKGLELIACGANGGDIGWTRGVLAEVSKKDVRMNGMAFHYYCGSAGDPVHFTNDEWKQLIRQAGYMQELINRHWSAAVSYGMENKAKLCIDEWGCWHPDGSGPSRGANLFEQQSTMRDAVVTALTLNLFNNNCEKIRLCAVAQLVNNLHALFLTSGAQCICTPTYHVFDMWKDHKGAEAIETVAPEDVSVSASVKDGRMTVTAANLSPDKAVTLSLEPFGFRIEGGAALSFLCDEDLHAHNT